MVGMRTKLSRTQAMLIRAASDLAAQDESAARDLESRAKSLRARAQYRVTQAGQAVAQDLLPKPAEGTDVSYEMDGPEDVVASWSDVPTVKPAQE